MPREFCANEDRPARLAALCLTALLGCSSDGTSTLLVPAPGDVRTGDTDDGTGSAGDTAGSGDDRGGDSTPYDECAVLADSPFIDHFPSYADGHTAAQWLFDDSSYPHVTLTDSSIGEQDLRLMQGGELVAGRFGGGLKVNAGPQYEVTYAGFRGSISNHHMRDEDGVPSGLWSPTVEPKRLLKTLTCAAWTLDLWLHWQQLPAATATVIEFGDALLPGFSAQFEPGATALVIDNHYAGERFRFAQTASALTTDTWHHIAIVYQAGTASLYIDGNALQAASIASLAVQAMPPDSTPVDLQHEHREFTVDSAIEWRRENRFNLSLGEDRSKAQELDATLDEIRFSSQARYLNEFALPGSVSRNFGASPPPAATPTGPPLLFPPEGPTLPLPLGARKHLFIDRALIDAWDNMKIKVNSLDQPEALTLATPGGVVSFIPEMGRWRETVYQHDGKIWIYIGEGYSTPKGRNWVFVSENGLDFTMPDVGLYDDPHWPNVILDAYPNGAIVFKDANPNIRSEELFKMSSWVSNRGIYMFVSPDGFHWRRNEVCMLPLAVGGDSEVFWDDQRGLYFNQMKRGGGTPTEQTPHSGRAGIGFKTDRALSPWPFTAMDQPYFESWPFPLMSDEGWTALPPREVISALGYALSEEVFRPRPMKYEWAPDTYVAFPHRGFFNLLDQAQHRSTELAASRDGETWTDYPYDDHGWLMPPVGTLDDTDVTEGLSFYGMVRQGDEIWLYVEYNTDGAPNGKDGLKKYFRLRMGLDRFAALNVGNKRGYAQTLPLTFEGTQLQLNINSGQGWIDVSLLDEAGAEIPGFGSQDADRIEGQDSLRQIVSWNGSSDLSSLAGQSIRLRFDVNNAKIYALQFVP